MKPGISFDVGTKKSKTDSWRSHWPNPADFQFNYYKLLNNTPKAIGTLKSGARKSIAIVGAGAAGMTAARELYRCGFNVTVFEASDRIGGRLYTTNNPTGLTQASMEMGAMRMPFFKEPGAENSILEYFLMKEPGEMGGGHEAILTPFPNPGQADGNTGIYINGGLGPENDFERPKLIDWKKGHDIDNPIMAGIAKRVGLFVEKFEREASDLYISEGNGWKNLWDKMRVFYDNMSFNDFVLADTRELDPSTGNIGGLGMNAKESELLYTIGIGDGSWGAFYNIGALWFMRCVLFGFSTKLQTVEGMGKAMNLPEFGRRDLRDRAGSPLPPPHYIGIQSLVEYLLYVPPKGHDDSFYRSNRTHLFIKTPVQSITKKGDKIDVKYLTPRGPLLQTFDFVMVTSPTWASEMSFDLKGFSEQELPRKKITAAATQHSISSCKLFFPLKRKYWESESKIPQILITDTYIQDVYGLSWDSRPQDRGILLASYTWEDDSNKLLPFDVDRLSSLVRAKLKEITEETLKEDITIYIDETRPVHIQWLKELTYHGCSKLYRPHTEQTNRLDLEYNEKYAAESKLYFAGENYSVEGGWTEPALRSAIDAVIRLLQHEDADFLVEGLKPGDYPSWEPQKAPTYTF